MDQKQFSGQKRISFWLLPSDENRGYFQNLIHHLSSEMEAAFLDPHVTIYAGKLVEDESSVELLEKVAGNITPIALQIHEIAYGTEFTKSFYIKFHPSDILNQITERFRTLCQTPSNYELAPHMSLFYKIGEEQKKEKLAKNTRLIQREVYFDCVRVVEHSEVIRTKEDIQSFKVLHELQLKSLQA